MPVILLALVIESLEKKKYYIFLMVLDRYMDLNLVKLGFDLLKT
jgi:hypothetical protein